MQAGEELLISYLGDKPSKDNTQLMKDYGFVLQGNLQDTITFQLAGGHSAGVTWDATGCPLQAVPLLTA